MCYLLVFAEPVVLFVSGEAFAGAVTPVRIIGAASLMSCVSYFVAMCILSPLGRERRMAVSSIAAAPASVVATCCWTARSGRWAQALRFWPPRRPSCASSFWCARDALSSFVRPRGLARMAVSNAVAVAVSAGCAWLLATAFSAGPGAIAIAGLLAYSAVGIAAAVALRGDTALMPVGKVRAVLRSGWPGLGHDGVRAVCVVGHIIRVSWTSTLG